MKTVCFFAVFLCLQLAAWAQAVPEAAAASAGSSAAAGAAKGVGKSVGGVFNSLSRTLSKTKQGAEQLPGAPAQPEQQAAANPARQDRQPDVRKFEPIDFTPLKLGVRWTDVADRLGTPDLRIIRNDGPVYVETLWYQRLGQPDAMIRVKNGFIERVEISPK